jgi:membrane protease YdiL (CAAX protease family)
MAKEGGEGIPWFKVLILVAVAFISKDVIPLLLMSPHNKWYNVFDFAVFLICMLITVFFMYGFSFEELSKATGIKREGLLQGMIVCFIFVILAFLGKLFFGQYTPFKMAQMSPFLSLHLFTAPLIGADPVSILDILAQPVPLLIFMLYHMLFAAPIEDIVFRGIIFTGIEGDSPTIFRTIFAVIFSAILFSLWHMDLYSASGIDAIFKFTTRFLFGIVFSIIFLLSKRNIFGAALFHGLNNTWVPVSEGIICPIIAVLGRFVS